MEKVNPQTFNTLLSKCLNSTLFLDKYRDCGLKSHVPFGSGHLIIKKVVKCHAASKSALKWSEIGIGNMLGLSSMVNKIPRLLDACFGSPFGIDFITLLYNPTILYLS